MIRFMFMKKESGSSFEGKGVWNVFKLSFPQGLIIMHTYSLFIHFSKEHTAHFHYFQSVDCSRSEACGNEASLTNMKQSVVLIATEVLPVKKRL